VQLRDRVLGILLGTAVGDALGLPYEGLPPARVARRLARHGPLRHSLVLGRGMLSDDTEHACLTARALMASRGDPIAFRRDLARRLRWWLLALPPAVGLATGRGIVRLWLGISPARSGVPSAGNGPLMRAAVIGALASDDAQLTELVAASTRMTHLDPRAEQAAIAIARFARAALPPAATIEAIADPELRARTHAALAAALEHADLETFRAALAFDRGVTGFVNDTLPAVVFCWQRWPHEPAAAIEAAIRLGGDTDTVAALVGALAGSSSGPAAFPTAWLAGIRDWPLTLATMHRLADALAHGSPAPRLSAFVSVPRNLLLLALVLVHAFARALGR
jgi:ADP-ribosyl-[dinitrogen reductase] hydrolase